MSNIKVSLPVIRRLPRYYRYITELKNNGVARVSSSQLAEIMGSTPSQVRQDFNCFGGFGQQGVGYSTETLQKEIAQLLFADKKLNAVLVGAGNLGVTILNFVIKDAKGVDVVAIFDKNPDVIGKTLNNLLVDDVTNISTFCENNSVDLFIICTPPEAAKDLAPTISASGVKGIWNYSHYDFSVFDSSFIVENVHLRDSLMALSYRVSHSEDIQE